MKVTIKAQGYEGIKAEVSKTSDHGAWVEIFRKGVDLAARTVFFTWSSLKEIKARKVKNTVPSTLKAGDRVTVSAGPATVRQNEYVAINGRSYVGVTIDGATKNASRRYLVSKVTRAAK